MEKMRKTTLGKKLALILRHNPSLVNGTLDNKGWLPIKNLLDNGWDLEEIKEIVRDDNKGRYEISNDEEKIRALQGHSIPGINADFEEYSGPTILYHGTQLSYVESILKEGLKKMSRDFVHLSTDIDTAITVAKRRGNNIAILEVNISGMNNVYVSKNGVVLVDYIDPSRIRLL